MNGTQLLRRSASIALTISLLAVTSCGVEFNGLFTGDGGVDDVATGMDVASADARVDARTDGSSDGRAPDVVMEDGRADIATDAVSGGDSSSDARDVGGSADAGTDITVVDARSDGSSEPDGNREDAKDVSNDPEDDRTVDSTSEPRIDVTNDPTVDIGLDAVADTSPDVTDGGPPGTCDAGACSTFANISPNVTRTVEMGPTPMMTGGTIVDGTYIVTSIVHYNNDISMYSLSETSIISGNMDAWIASTNGGAPVRYTTYFTTASPNQMSFTFCCPAPANLTILYTSDGTTLAHVDPANPNRVITYTRQ
ncbi:MAG: hypothetical protein ABW133_21795 [Polyangiaceae bacterium]